MNKAGNITAVNPPYAIPGGEITIECSGFTVRRDGANACIIGGDSCRIVAASSTRVIAIAPTVVGSGEADIVLRSGEDTSAPYTVQIAEKLIDDMHIVANPAIDPRDESLVVTRSGSRGESLPNTLYRLEADGYIDEMPVSVMNPTGIAFDPTGEMYVTNRSDGWVVRIERGEEAVTYAAGLGVATGIAFDSEGVLYVGDRSGKIHRVPEAGYAETFAVLEPSVSAYHMAFGPDDTLYVAAPGLSSHDAIHAVDREGGVSTYFRGLGRPQGLAFDDAGNLYAAACYRGRHGIVKIRPGGFEAEMFVAGMNVVGLCFTRAGDMVVATGDAAYSLPLGIYGTLLQ